MRSLFYATTALTAAALIAGAGGDAAAQTQPREVPPPPPPTQVSKSAARIKLTLSGYYQQWAVITDQSYKTRPAPGASANHQPTNMVDNKHNSEICVIGQTTLDNGLTIGVNVQIEAFSQSDSIDESYIFVESPTLGQLLLGDENNVGYLLHVEAPDGGISLDDGDLVNINAFETGDGVINDSPISSTNLRLNDNDSGKFTYITPRFAGLQAGVSYIPQFEVGGDNNSALRKSGTGDIPDAGGSARNTGQYNGWAGGLNFDDEFGDFGVQASGGVLWAQSGAGVANLSNKDLLAYNAGAQFSFAGFSVGGAWLYVPQGQRTATTRFNGQSWSVGGTYEFGPYKVGLDYMFGDNNKTPGGGKDRLEQAVVSGTRVLGPGIRLVGGVFYYDWEEENKLSQNKNGIGGTTAIKLSF